MKNYFCFILLLIVNFCSAQKIVFSQNPYTKTVAKNTDTVIIEYRVEGLAFEESIAVQLQQPESGTLKINEHYRFISDIKNNVSGRNNKGKILIELYNNSSATPQVIKIIANIKKGNKTTTGYTNLIVNYASSANTEKDATEKTSSSKNDTKQESDNSKAPEKEEQTIISKDLNFNHTIYITRVKKINGLYFLNLCGAVYDKTQNSTYESAAKLIKADSCIISHSKITSLMGNKSAFILMANKTFKQFDKSFDTANVEYKITVLNLYNSAIIEDGKKELAIREESSVEKIKKEVLQEIADEKNSFTAVGHFVLKNLTVPLYYSIRNSNSKYGSTCLKTDCSSKLSKKERKSSCCVDEQRSTVRIDSVLLSTESGRIAKKGIRVYTDSGLFFNEKTSIPILNLGGKRCDNLVHEDNRELGYIKICDFLMYDHRNGQHFPDDVDDMLINKDNKTRILTSQSNLNSLINFSLYTDLAGLLGRRPNGVLISNVTGRFMTNAGNLRNSDLSLFNFVEPNITITRFDNKFRSLDSSQVKMASGKPDTVNRMFLNQIAWLKGSLKLNLLRYRVAPNQFLHINIGAQINVVNADSLFKKETDINFFNYLLPEVSYTVQRLKNFGMEASCKLLRQRISDSAPFVNRDMESILVPQVAFYYYPSQKSSSTIYLRFNYYNNLKISENNFYQLQFGWKTGLKLSK